MPRTEDKLKSCAEPCECAERRKHNDEAEEDEVLEANNEFLQSSADAEACEERDAQACQKRHDLDPRDAETSLSSLRSKGVRDVGFAALGKAHDMRLLKQKPSLSARRAKTDTLV
jgi:hypothetical protein